MSEKPDWSFLLIVLIVLSFTFVNWRISGLEKEIAEYRRAEALKEAK